MPDEDNNVHGSLVLYLESDDETWKRSICAQSLKWLELWYIVQVLGNQQVACEITGYFFKVQVLMVPI